MGWSAMAIAALPGAPDRAWRGSETVSYVHRRIREPEAYRQAPARHWLGAVAERDWRCCVAMVLNHIGSRDLGGESAGGDVGARAHGGLGAIAASHRQWRIALPSADSAALDSPLASNGVCHAGYI